MQFFYFSVAVLLKRRDFLSIYHCYPLRIKDMSHRTWHTIPKGYIRGTKLYSNWLLLITIDLGKLLAAGNPRSWKHGYLRDFSSIELKIVIQNYKLEENAVNFVVSEPCFLEQLFVQWLRSQTRKPNFPNLNP